MWKEILTNSDIKDLMVEYGYFHDSCLRDIHISTNDFVDEKLAMHFDNISVGTLLFQRQFDSNTVLEMKFENVDRLNFNPPGETYNGVIYDATFKKVNELFYWADEEDWEIGDIDANWISSTKIYWRYRNHLRGNVVRLKED